MSHIRANAQKIKRKAQQIQATSQAVVQTQLKANEAIHSYNEELAKYLPESLLSQMKLVSDFKIPEELQNNLNRLKTLGDEINDTNQQLNAQVFQLSNDNETDDIDFSRYHNQRDPNKVNKIIDESEITGDMSISFNPSYLAQNWIAMGYGTVALKSKTKGYLFKLLDFNKVAIQEAHQFMRSNSLLENLCTKFMFCEGSTDLDSSKALISNLGGNQTVAQGTPASLQDELQEILLQLEDPGLKIESTMSECQSVILSMIRYMDTKTKELYRQCHKYGLIEQTKVAMYARQMNKAMKQMGPNQRGGSVFGDSVTGPHYKLKAYDGFLKRNRPISQKTVFQLFFKDTIPFKRQYLQIVIKMVKIFQEVKVKAQVLKPVIDKIFNSIPSFKYIEAEKIMTGFFFFYIYKDFVLREVIFQYSNTDEHGIDPNQLKHIFIDRIALEYNKFIQYDFVQWINLMLGTEVFQSYYSIVSPNEAQPDPEQKHTCNIDYLESINYQILMEKNLKNFVNSLPYITQKQNLVKKKPIGEITYSSDTDCFQLQVDRHGDNDHHWDEVVQIQKPGDDFGFDQDAKEIIDQYTTLMLGGQRGGAEQAAGNHHPNSLFYDETAMRRQRNQEYEHGDYLPDEFDDSSSIYSNVELSNDSSDMSDQADNMIFTLGKNQGGQRVKIDLKNFSKTKYTQNPFKDYSIEKVVQRETQVNTQDLKSSCLCLIDQLAHYYDNYHDNLRESENQAKNCKTQQEQAMYREKQLEQYQKLQQCMKQTKQFLQIIQSNKGEGDQFNKLNFSADQEKVVRELIDELKWHLSKFSEDHQVQSNQIRETDFEMQRYNQEQATETDQVELFKEQHDCSCANQIDYTNMDQLVNQYNNMQCPCCRQKFLVNNFLTSQPKQEKINAKKEVVQSQAKTKQGGQSARKALRQKIEQIEQMQQLHEMQKKHQELSVTNEKQLEELNYLMQNLEQQQDFSQKRTLVPSEIQNEIGQINIQEFSRLAQMKIEEQQALEKAEKARTKNQKRRQQKKMKKKQEKEKVELQKSEQKEEPAKSSQNCDTITNSSSINLVKQLELKKPDDLERVETHEESDSKQCKLSRSSSFSIDPEFEESLQNFRNRLDSIYKHPGNQWFEITYNRLIPNVSEDWLLEIKRKNQGTKSKSPFKSQNMLGQKNFQGNLKVQSPHAPSSPQAQNLKNRLANVLGGNCQATKQVKQKSNSDISHTER